jgi:hypothetical protein
MDQQDRNESVAGGKGTIVIGGQTYLVDQINDRHMATLSAYLRKRIKSPLEMVMASIKSLTPELQKVAIAEAVKLQAGGPPEITRGFIEQQLLEPEPLSFLIWILIRGNHPDQRHDEAFIKVVSDAGAETLLTDLYLAAGLSKLQGN